MDLSFASPAGWDELDEATRQSSLLDDDFCQIRYGDGVIERFVRAVLPLPVPTIDGEFRFGVWMSVSEASWDVYSKGFDTDVYDVEGCFGYLGNLIPGFESAEYAHADLYFRDDHQRPVAFLHASDHPVACIQRDGITVAQIEVWAAMTHQG